MFPVYGVTHVPGCSMPSLGELEPKFSRYLFTGVQQ